MPNFEFNLEKRDSLKKIVKGGTTLFLFMNGVPMGNGNAQTLDEIIINNSMNVYNFGTEDGDIDLPNAVAPAFKKH